MAHRSTSDFIMMQEDFEPAYLKLHRSGILKERVEEATRDLEACKICPRKCGTNRMIGENGVCKSGRYAAVASCHAHMGEEDCLRGWRGSGTIFFSRCNLKCVFCQNFDISQLSSGTKVGPSRLAAIMLQLQDIGCHNINFVTPEHVVPQILQALPIAIEKGLRLPLVYNTSAYDSLHSLHLMDGIVDIYMPDFKIWDPDLALKYLKAKDYPEVARRAIIEMHTQVGVLKFGEDGLARRGVLVRHLIMPNEIANSSFIMNFLADLSYDTYINIMDQYYPSGKVGGKSYAELNRRITRPEYFRVMDSALRAGLWRFDRPKISW